MSEIQRQQQSKIVAIGNDAEFINSQVELGDRSMINALEHYRNAGERLSKVREDIKSKGQRYGGVTFLQWISQNCKFKQRIAYNYIEIFDNWSEFCNVLQDSNLSLRSALKLIAESKVTEKEIDDQVWETVEARATEVIDTKEKEATKKLTKAEQIEKNLDEKRKKDEEFIAAEKVRLAEKEKSDRLKAEKMEHDLNEKIKQFQLEKESVKAPVVLDPNPGLLAEIEKLRLEKESFKAPVVLDPNPGLLAEAEKAKAHAKDMEQKLKQKELEESDRLKADAINQQSLKKIQLLESQLQELKNQPPKVVEKIVEKYIEVEVINESKIYCEEDKKINEIMDLSEEELRNLPKSDTFRSYLFDFILNIESTIKYSTIPPKEKNYFRTITRHMIKRL